MGCGASGSRHDIYYVEEVTAGVTPDTPAFKEFRNGTWDVNYDIPEVETAEMRSDGNVANVGTGNEQGSGSISSPFAALAFDDALEALFRSSWVGDVLKNGTTERSFTFESRFLDIAQYVRDQYQVFSSLTLTIDPGAEVTAVWGFNGGARTVAQTIITGATYTPAATNAPFDNFLGTLSEGGVTSAIVTSLTVTIDLGTTVTHEVTNKTPACISTKVFNVTGSATMQFIDEVMMNKYLNGTESSLEFSLVDGTATQTHLLPRIKYNSATTPKNGTDDIFITLGFRALLDPTEAATYKITRS